MLRVLNSIKKLNNLFLRKHFRQSLGELGKRQVDEESLVQDIHEGELKSLLVKIKRARSQLPLAKPVQILLDIMLGNPTRFLVIAPNQEFLQAKRIRLNSLRAVMPPKKLLFHQFDQVHEQKLGVLRLINLTPTCPVQHA
jgi:hypothetical protein